MRIVLFLFLIGLAEQSFAFRCGNQLVSIGDTRYEVEAICGVPDDAATRSYFRSISNQQVIDCQQPDTLSVESLGTPSTNSASQSCLSLVEDRLAVRVDVDVWLYDFGRNRFMQQVQFENGYVVKIDALDYGVKPRR